MTKLFNFKTEKFIRGDSDEKTVVLLQLMQEMLAKQERLEDAIIVNKDIETYDYRLDILEKYIADFEDKETFNDLKDRLKTFVKIKSFLKRLVELSKNQGNKYLNHGSIITYDSIKYSKAEELTYQQTNVLCQALKLLNPSMGRADVIAIDQILCKNKMDWLPFGDDASEGKVIEK